MEDGDFNSFFDCIMNDSEGTASCETTSKPADLQETTPVQNDLDDFFDCINEQSTEETDLKPAPIYESKADDSVELDEFFDCINSPHNEEVNSTSNEQENKRKMSKKPKKQRDSQTFKDYQERKVNVDIIKTELASFQSCCKLCCYLWLNVQFVLFCRTQYILLDTFEDRRTWLARRMDELSIGPQTFSYHIDVLSAERRKACAKAWRFAYGVPEATHKRAMQKRSNPRPNNKKGKGKLSTAVCGLFIAWLLAFADRVRDKLPFGNGNDATVQIRLPFPNKKMVYNIYRSFEKNDNVTSVSPVIHYSTATLAWKNDPDAKHIKLAKHKEGFSKCDMCCEYDRKIAKQMTVSAREALDIQFYSHIAETRKERQQYYKAKTKAINNPNQCISIIMDSMDQRKTCVPFFSNPPKCIGSDYVLKTKVIATIVHGHGAYLYWCTDQIKHDSNLTIECLRRTLIKFESEKGKLPPTLYLQLDNGPDQKSRQFLAFIAYLVESGVFQKIKVSYLIVGHTHEDVDQYFSCISRYIRKTLKQLLSVECLINALKSCFKTPGCIPKYVEQVNCCYDTRILEDKFLDKHLARFDLNECTGDKTHYLVMRRDEQGKAVMQYKLKRYSDALYPRMYNINDDFHCQKLGTGTVVEAKPQKDPVTKLKYWAYAVTFKHGPVDTLQEIYQLPCSACAITMFPGYKRSELPNQFPLAPFKGTIDETLGEQRKGVESIIKKLDFDQLYPSQAEHWQYFWNSIPTHIDSISVDHQIPFCIPKQSYTVPKPPKKPLSLCIDDGVRAVEPVQHSNFKAGCRKRKLRDFEASVQRMDSLKQGDMVVVNMVPEHSEWYNLPFVIAEIEKDISHLDTTNADCEFEVQVFRPKDKNNSLHKPFVKWQGEDNVYWKPTIERGLILSTVTFTPKSKKLSPQSLEFVRKHHLNSATR